MKTFKVSLFILIAMLSFSAYADSDSSTTYTVEVTQSIDPYVVDNGPVRHRTPPRPLICTISTNGINIQSVNTEEIIAYDIYDTEGGCIATFTNEQDFISFIYSLEGTVEIRVHTDGYVFHGYVQL